MRAGDGGDRLRIDGRIVNMAMGTATYPLPVSCATEIARSSFDRRDVPELSPGRHEIAFTTATAATSRVIWRMR
jgi:hypothetical protein